MGSKTDIWMPLYIGDYLADTTMLDAEQSGCYLHWLMCYWRTGPLEDDLPALIQIGKLRSSDAREIALGILQKFFFKDENGRWRQKRIDQERAYSASMKQAHSKGGASRAQALNSAQKSEIARLGAKKRWENAKIKDLDACYMLAECLQDACPSQSQSHKEKKTIPREVVEEIYQAYPKHEGKLDALKAIEKAILSNGHDSAWYLERVKAFALQARGSDPKYIPYPATWFNKGHYYDEPAKKKSPLDGMNLLSLEDFVNQ